MDELLANRTKLRAKATKFCNDFRSYREGDRTSLDPDQLALKLHHLEKLKNELQGIQVQLDKVGQTDDANHVQSMEDESFLGSRLLARLEKAAEAQGNAELQSAYGGTVLKTSLAVKIPTFHGDVMKWAEFWELFCISVHNNASFANVQKFVVLKSHLGGIAVRSIQGIPVTGDGYAQAVAVLKERFELDDVRRDRLLKDLLSMPSVRQNDLKAMRSFIDHMSAHTRALSTLGVASESFSSLLLPVARDKIPEDWRLEWARRGSCSFDDFLAFLNQEIRIRESARGVSTPTISDDSEAIPSSVPSTTSSLNARREPTGSLNARRDSRSESSRPSRKSRAMACGVCGLGHQKLDQCERFRRMPVDDRWRTAAAVKVWFLCLEVGHRARDCRGDPCVECGRKHHSLLHNPGFSSRDLSVATPTLSPKAAPFCPKMTLDRGTRSDKESGDLLRQTHHSSNNETRKGCRTYFQTAVVVASGPKGRRPARVLFDGGSDSSYVRSSLVKELGLPVTGTGTFSCLGFQEKTEEARQYEKVQIDLERRFGGCSVTLDMWSTDQLCSPLPTTSPPHMPSRLEMADDFGGGDVELLIGIDNMYRVVLWEQIELDEGLRAIETIFGYVLHGCSGDSHIEQPHQRNSHSRQIESMWDLDTVGIREREMEEPGSKAYPQPAWNEQEDRYSMGLLWKSEDRPVSNQASARARTSRMVSRLSEEKAILYGEQILGMMENAVIEHSSPTVEAQTLEKLSDGEHEEPTTDEGPNRVDVPREAPCDPQWGPEKSRPGLVPAPPASGEFFLPHHGVFRNDKLRVVFDGSAKDGVGQSLNDYLDAGENLLVKLPTVLLNFRSGKIGCQADIQAAFHQVAVSEEDRRYLQFFWSDTCLRFARVPFGLTCSPFMLLRTVTVHLNRYIGSDEELCHLIQAGSYMDDICLHFEKRSDAETAVARAKEIFAEAKMTLHKIRMTGDESPPASVLGLRWDTQSDRLSVVVPEFPCPSTKSGLLSAVAKPFDPLGLLTPWLIGGKILFQRTWKDTPNAKWDDPLDAAIQAEVEIWLKNATGKAVSFPRPLTRGKDDSNMDFHVFCDASERAYCAAVYVVHGMESRLVMAKGRLAPICPNLTIPRLELMAAVNGARLMNFVKESLALETPSVSFWTDSTDVLYWIRNRKQRKVFVQNRVSTILQLTDPKHWKHVKGVENPADLGTRGITFQAMIESDRWWRGPSFLREKSCPAGAEESIGLSSDAKCEEKAEATPRAMTPRKHTLKVQQADVRLFDITECSSLKMVINKTAWLMRFVFNVRRTQADRRTGPLTSEERCHALQFWIKEAQARMYEAELDVLRKGTLLPKGSPLVKLRPRLDDNGVMCAIPRTNEVPLPILPEFAYISTLIIDEAHRRCFHQGARATLAVLSAEYLVRRRSVLRVVNTCRRCRRYRGQMYRSADGGLPSFRTEPSRAFTKVGMDFFGPLVTEAGRKVWVLLITCATSRAVHLELVKSQHLDDVKLALRRFFAIRGIPSLVFSDNAKTFHALLPHLPRTVTWRFIPEAAPWWGGFWERMVGITKKCLRITLHLCNLSYDELAATLYELAFHLNMRPLTTVDEEMLTPAHLLFGVTTIRVVMAPSNVFCDQITRAWRHQRRVSEHLIRRWTKEYVASLRSWSVSSWGRPTHTPDVGDVVLVCNEGPRGRWPLARVIGLISGSDCQPRAAHIEMRGKKTRRPLNRLYRLEAA